MRLQHSTGCINYKSAITDRYFAITELLFESGADASADSGSALHEAIQMQNVELISLLLDHGGDVNLAPEGYGSALDYARSVGLNEIYGLLLVKGEKSCTKDATIPLV